MFGDHCLQRLLSFHSASGRRKRLGQRLRQAKAPPHGGGDVGGPCLPAPSVIGRGEGLGGASRGGRGRLWAWPLLGVASDTAPSRGLKADAAAGAGPEHGGRSQGGSWEPAVEQCPGGAEQVQAAAGAAGAGPGRGQGASRDH